jgi:hypothetical protein
MVADEVCLYDAKEVPRLLKIAKKLARKNKSLNVAQLRAAF